MIIEIGYSFQSEDMSGSPRDADARTGHAGGSAPTIFTCHNPCQEKDLHLTLNT